MAQDIFVCNASPLIAFERLDKLSLLKQLTSKLVIPSAVRKEVFGNQPAPDWIVEQKILQPLSSVTLSPRLGAGEREAIVLALEKSPCYLLLDDLAARRAAQALDIAVIGTVGLLILARQRKLIPKLKPHLDALLARDFRVSERLYDLALSRVQE